MRKASVKLCALLLLAPLMACAEAQPPACVVDCQPWKCVEEQHRADMCTMLYKIGTECYARHSTCTRQPNGQCGWTPSAELQTCLDDAEAMIPKVGGGQ